MPEMKIYTMEYFNYSGYRGLVECVDNPINSLTEKYPIRSLFFAVKDGLGVTKIITNIENLMWFIDVNNPITVFRCSDFLTIVKICAITINTINNDDTGKQYIVELINEETRSFFTLDGAIMSIRNERESSLYALQMIDGEMRFNSIENMDDSVDAVIYEVMTVSNDPIPYLFYMGKIKIRKIIRIN